MVDGKLAALTSENENIDELIVQLQRRKEIVEGRFELLVAERDLLDERIWQGQQQLVGVVRLGPRPPVVRGRYQAPRELTREPWDFEELEAALAC